MSRAIEQSADKERRAYLIRRSKLYLEGAIGALLDTLSPAEVVGLLRAQAQHLEDHG